MATVRLTDQIRSAVRMKIEALFNERIAKKHEELKHLDVGMQVFLSRIPAAQVEAAQKLNQDVTWVPEISSLNVRIEYIGIDGNPKTATFTVPFKPPVPAPQEFHGYSAHQKNVVRSTMACYQPCVDILLEHDSMIRERDTLRDSIAALLNDCGTLRQVLEKWPTALDFMPDEVKAKHAEKVDPAKKGVKVISEVDEQAKMLLMKARMLNGV